MAGQLGLEAMPEEYIENMRVVGRELFRVLRDDGTLWLNVGNCYASSTIVSQKCIMRDDLTIEEKVHVAMEMFGVSFNGETGTSEGSLLKLLRENEQGQASSCRSDLEIKGIQGQLSAQQGQTIGDNARETPTAQMASDRETGGQVRMLRGGAGRVSNCRSHQRRRGGSSEGANGKESGEFAEDLHGHTKSRFPQRTLSSSVLQLQLLNRLLGILSTHTFEEHELPDSIRFAFTSLIAFKQKDEIDLANILCEALRCDGWYRRATIIWAKKNAMPESVRDRPTRSHEMIYLLTKRKTYYYDNEAVKEKVGEPTRRQKTFRGGCYTNNKTFDNSYDYSGHDPYSDDESSLDGRNQRDVWVLSTEAYQGAHYATFPTEIPRRAILAGTSAKGHCEKCGKGWVRIIKKIVHETSAGRKHISGNGRMGGNGWEGIPRATLETNTVNWQSACKCDTDVVPAIILDPFCGSGTVGEVCRELGRRFIGLDLSMKYLRENATPRAERSQTPESIARLPLFGGNGDEQLPLKQDATNNPTYTGFNARWKETHGD